MYQGLLLSRDENLFYVYDECRAAKFQRYVLGRVSQEEKCFTKRVGIDFPVKTKPYGRLRVRFVWFSFHEGLKTTAYFNQD